MLLVASFGCCCAAVANVMLHCTALVGGDWDWMRRPLWRESPSLPNTSNFLTLLITFLPLLSPSSSLTFVYRSASRPLSQRTWLFPTLSREILDPIPQSLSLPHCYLCLPAIHPNPDLGRLRRLFLRIPWNATSRQACPSLVLPHFCARFRPFCRPSFARQTHLCAGRRV